MRLKPIRKIRKLIQRSFLYRKYAENALSGKQFEFNEKAYPYFIHSHNYTWTNERAVELAIARDEIQSRTAGRTLEVGNVTRHYFATEHDVVDKYEKASGILNVDIVDFHPEKNYDFVFAISTLEHVGWDRDRREGDKIPIAVEKLKQLLNPGGELLITVPIGFNSFLDDFLAEQSLGFNEIHFLKRVSHTNQWQQADWDGVSGTHYNSPFNNANAIAVARYTRAA